MGFLDLARGAGGDRRERDGEKEAVVTVHPPFDGARGDDLAYVLGQPVGDLDEGQIAGLIRVA